MEPALDVSAARPLAPPVAVPDDALWDELRALNDQLRSLASIDQAARAWVESWVALVAVCVTAKLTADHLRIPSKFPWVAPIVGVLAVALVVDVIRRRRRYRALEKRERVQLDRQRELRTMLGVDDAPVPQTNSEGTI